MVEGRIYRGGMVPYLQVSSIAIVASYLPQFRAHSVIRTLSSDSRSSIMSSFLDKVKDVAVKASDKYQEQKDSSSKDEGTYDPSKNDDYPSSNKQSGSDSYGGRDTSNTDSYSSKPANSHTQVKTRLPPTTMTESKLALTAKTQQTAPTARPKNPATEMTAMT